MENQSPHTTIYIYNYVYVLTTCLCYFTPNVVTNTLNLGQKYGQLKCNFILVNWCKIIHTKKAAGAGKTTTPSFAVILPYIDL